MRSSRLPPWLVRRRPAGWLCSVPAVAAWVLIAPDARAQPDQHVDLRYAVDPALEGCLTEVEFRSVVARRLGYDPHRPGATPRVQVVVRGTETGIEGTVEWISKREGRIGERRFSSPGGNCHDMTVTMAFVVAVQTQLMAAEPGRPALAEATETEPEPARTNASGPKQTGAGVEDAPAGEPAQPAFAVDSDASRWWATAGIGPAVGWGMGPHAVGLGRLFLSLNSGWIGAELGAEATLPSTTHVDGGAGFRHELILATLAACGSRGSVAVCAVGKLGSLRVRGTGVDNPASPSGLVGQIGTRLAYSLGLGHHLTLQGHLEGLCLPTPWTIDLNQVAVWTMPRFGAAAGMALARRFP